MNSIAMRRARAASPIADEVHELIIRYPDLADHELERLIDIYPRLPMLEAGLMTADERLAPKLDAFHEAHGHRIRMPLSHLAIFLSVPLFYLLVAAWFLLRG